MEFSLSDENNIPAVGLGTWDLRGKECINTVLMALDIGYRHIDTAEMYGNETEIGKAIAQHEIPREDLFLTSKVWTSSLGYKQTIQAFNSTIGKLGTDYLDLYLIHWPGNDTEKRKESYRALVELQASGSIKSIGVSNFSPDQIRELESHFDQPPAVNQIYYNFRSYDEPTVDFCRSNNIQLVAYTPLNKGRGFDTQTIKDIAQKHNKTTSQVILRWCLDQNVVVIPKSANRQRLALNLDLFDFQLSQEEIQQIGS